MLQEDIIKAVESMAPPARQASWDCSGLQVASANAEVATLGVFLDPAPASIEAALAKGADFMLSHHPLALRPRLPNKIDAYYEALQLLLGADAGLYAAHTSLDVNLAGPASWIGHSLGLEGIEPLEPIDDSSQYGFGGVGNLPRPMPFRDVIDKTMTLCRLKASILAGPPPEEPIRRIAWCCGSGGSLIERAKMMEAGLFITGDLKYHDALTAGIPVLDVGHHALEEEMAARLAVALQRRLPELRIIFIPSKSPFKIIERRPGSAENE